MKKFLTILLSCAAVLFLMCSCSRYGSQIERVNDEISGIYVLTDALWDGTAPFDLDGDTSTAGNDILGELGGYGNVTAMIETWGATVTPIYNAECPDANIYIKIPLQATRENTERLEIDNIITPGISFEYTVDKAGKVIVGDCVDYSEVYCLASEYSNSHYMNVSDARISMLSDRQLIVELTLSYYDYCSHSIVTGPVTLKFRWNRNIRS